MIQRFANLLQVQFSRERYESRTEKSLITFKSMLQLFICIFSLRLYTSIKYLVYKFDREREYKLQKKSRTIFIAGKNSVVIIFYALIVIIIDN